MGKNNIYEYHQDEKDRSKTHEKNQTAIQVGQKDGERFKKKHKQKYSEADAKEKQETLLYTFY
ncbi:MAG: hypothetical protein ACQEQ0_01440 [Bacteroidota bacterium]